MTCMVSGGDPLSLFYLSLSLSHYSFAPLSHLSLGDFDTSREGSHMTTSRRLCACHALPPCRWLTSRNPTCGSTLIEIEKKASLLDG